MMKKVIGIIFILLGIAALVTPFTPGSWLVFVGLELLGVRIAFWEKIKTKFINKKTDQE
jgi:hypothetical protein